MPLPREIIERVERVAEFHRATKHTYRGVHDAKPPDPAQQTSPYRVFDDRLKVPLPTTLLDAPEPTLSLMTGGLDALPESQLQFPQDIRTLASWLFMAYGLTSRKGMAGGSAGKSGQSAAKWQRSCPSEDDTYPCEIYVAAFAVEGLEPGFYHYSPREFALRRLRGAWETLAHIKKGRPDLEFLKTVPAVLLVSTVFCRSSWKFRKRGYRHATADAGRLVQNLVTAGLGLGLRTLVRQVMNENTMRELIGLTPESSYGEEEAVQAAVVWADTAKNPLKPPSPGGSQAGAPSPGQGLLPIPRKPLAADVMSYGSILAVHHDCVAPGVAVREVRPPLTEMVVLASDYPTLEFPIPDPPEGGMALRKLLLTRTPAERYFRNKVISREALWTINRAAFRGGSYFPLFPDGPHAALVRPLWAINGVAGMDSGIWHYHVKTDKWSLMRQEHSRIELQYALLEEPACGEASAVCFMVSHLAHLTHTAGPDLYRLAHLEAGAVGQRIYLAANALGLGASNYGGFYDDDVRILLGISNTQWDVIYAAAVGVVDEPVDGVEPSTQGGIEGGWMG